MKITMKVKPSFYHKITNQPYEKFDPIRDFKILINMKGSQTYQCMILKLI